MMELSPGEDKLLLTSISIPSHFYLYFILSDVSIDVSTFIADLLPNSASRLLVPSLPFSTYLYFNLYLSLFDLNS